MFDTLEVQNVRTVDAATACPVFSPWQASKSHVITCKAYPIIDVDRRVSRYNQEKFKN